MQGADGHLLLRLTASSAAATSFSASSSAPPHLELLFEKFHTAQSATAVKLGQMAPQVGELTDPNSEGV